jgi:hypothetical protein
VHQPAEAGRQAGAAARSNAWICFTGDQQDQQCHCCSSAKLASIVQAHSVLVLL